MSAQPIWITPPGNLYQGTLREGEYYQVPPFEVENPSSDPLYFEVIAGSLPTGMVCTVDGIVQGIPSTEIITGEIVTTVNRDVTSKFAVRAYTTKVVDGVTVINRLADRTFTLTVAGQQFPRWVTPPGPLGQFWTGELMLPGLQLQYINDNPTDVPPAISLVSGQLPPGLTISNTGLISGYIQYNPSFSVLSGYSRDGQGYNEYPFDFNTDSESYNYEFVLKVTDGKTSAIQAFQMFVWSNTIFTADTTLITADNTYLDASISSLDIPVLLNPQGSIGTVRNDNFFAYQFIGEDLNGEQIGYVGFNLPPGLTLDPKSGWLYGYLPALGLTEVTYNFSIVPYQYYNSEAHGSSYHYSLTVQGEINQQVIWLTPSFLGAIDNGSPSTFYVAASNFANLTLEYYLLSGSNSRLPQGLTLLPSGNIVGRVSFDTFALDSGTTYFDRHTTTFDEIYTFTVNAISPNGTINVTKTFTIRVIRRYNEPYNNLYIQAMPPQNDRALVNSLLTNATIFPPSLLYRPDDPDFGLSQKVIYWHAYGLTAATIDEYIDSMVINHYWKELQLGEIKTARALDDLGNVLYEVVYSEIVDDMVNNQGEPVGKEVVLAYPVDPNTLKQVDVVYPNALEDMRVQVIDVVGQISNILPRWMLSKQIDGNVLGFTPAWVIAYTIPGAAGQVAYNIQTQFGDQLNLVDYKADRYELDNSMTVDWNRAQQEWIPTPPESTTFDINYHYQTTVQNYMAGGLAYSVGDVIKILGSNLGGVDGANDCFFVVNTVDNVGDIINAFCYGTASIIMAGSTFTGAVGVNVIGTGTGATWNISVVPGTETIFDGGSMNFTAPAGTFSETDAFNKYLMFPRYNILTPVPTVDGIPVNWINDSAAILPWVNEDGDIVGWIHATP
jgi:hypothetical protein